MTQTRIHPETGQVLRRDARVQTVSVGSMSREVEVPGWYPEDDGDSIHSGAELQAMDQAYLELRTAYAARVKAVRKKLGLTQEEAADLAGFDRRTLVSFESGTGARGISLRNVLSLATVLGVRVTFDARPSGIDLV